MLSSSWSGIEHWALELEMYIISHFVNGEVAQWLKRALRKEKHTYRISITSGLGCRSRHNEWKLTYMDGIYMTNSSRIGQRYPSVAARVRLGMTIGDWERGENVVYWHFMYLLTMWLMRKSQLMLPEWRMLTNRILTSILQPTMNGYYADIHIPMLASNMRKILIFEMHKINCIISHLVHSTRDKSEFPQ